MGWGTAFKTEVYLNKMTFQNIYELEIAIESAEAYITQSEKKLLMLAAASPKDICDEDVEVSPLSYIQTETQELIDSLLEDKERLVLLELFKEHLEETGKNIEDYNPFKNG